MYTGSEYLLPRLRRDPEFFCREVLGINPWGKQMDVLHNLRDHDRVAVRSGHGTGKSFIASAAALWFLYSFHPAKVITTAPTWNQVRHILWNEIRRLHSSAKVPLGGTVLEERIKLSPGAFAIGLSTDEPERLQGFHAEHLLVILDEAPGVAEELWHAAETLLTGRVGKMLAIGNPTRPSGLFYEAFSPDSSWAQVHISCLDSPNVSAAKNGCDDNGSEIPYPRLVTPRWIEGRAREWGTDSPLWKARVLGEFPDDDSSLLIPRHWLEGAASSLPASPVPGASSPPDAPGSGPLLGVDVGRHGTDDTVFLLRDDAQVLYVEAVNGWSTMRTAGRVVSLMEERGIPPADVFVDDTGLGAGVTDRLREQGHEINAVISAARSSDPSHFLNARAEFFWKLRQRLSPDSDSPFGIAKDFSSLRRELAALSFEYASSGAIKITDKVELRGRLSGSPNHADALALTFANRESRDPEVMIF